MIRGYYFITDAGLSVRGNLRDVRDAVRAGAAVVQYREKGKPTCEMVAEACRIRRLCADTLFIVNDRVDVALASRADGVHLGNDDMPYAAARRLLGGKRIIGVTVHSVREARAAERAGADYVGVSPIFATSTKKDAGAPGGVGLVRRVRRAVSLPVVAIGGITLENAPAVIGAGADAVCAVSAVVASPDPLRAVREFQRLFGK